MSFNLFNQDLASEIEWAEENGKEWKVEKLDDLTLAFYLGGEQEPYSLAVYRREEDVIFDLELLKTQSFKSQNSSST